MPRPLIAITGGAKKDQPKWKETHVSVAGCQIDYITAIQDAGGAPVMLPFTADEECVRAVLAKCDGLLLTGGGDIDPAIYGEQPHPKTGTPQPMRDAMELVAIKIANDLDLPILGICRGIQMLNVAMGGTLVQDIPSQAPSEVKHSFEGTAPDMAHDIFIEADSILAEVLETNKICVNSRHHQSVDGVGRGLKVCARAEDGIVEGVESSEGKPILAVQFHPENICKDHPRFRKLFDWLINQASKHNA